MYIKGIGRICKSEVVSVLSSEGLRSLADGDLTLDDVASMYKLQQVKKCTPLGSLPDTFYANYSRIPDNLKADLPPADLAALVDAFYHCHCDSSKKDG